MATSIYSKLKNRSSEQGRDGRAAAMIHSAAAVIGYWRLVASRNVWENLLLGPVWSPSLAIASIGAAAAVEGLAKQFQLHHDTLNQCFLASY